MTFIPGMQGQMAAGLAMGADLRILRDLVLETGRGPLALSGAIVAPQGVFAVFSGKGSGEVSGFAGGAEWVLTGADGSKTRMENPLVQNAEKLRALAAGLGLSPEKLRPVVVFAGDVRLARGLPENVVLRSALPYVRTQVAHVLTGPEMAQVMQALQKLSREDARRAEGAGMGGSVAPVQQGRCPKCGAPLVLEISRSGENAGRPMRRCANYPRCRFASFT